MESEARVTIRSMAPQDQSMIMATWKCGYASSNWAKRLEKWEYFAIINHLLPTIMQRCRIMVCALEDDPDVIVGWIAVSYIDGDTRLVYGYVKPPFRGMGIFRALMGTTGCDSFAVNPLKTLVSNRGRKEEVKEDQV